MERFDKNSDYINALGRIQEQAERFHRAALGKFSNEEKATAWREFSELVARVVRSGRLWDPPWVQDMAPALLAMDAEQREVERVERELAEAGDDKAEIKKVSSSIAGLSSLVVVDKRAVEFEEDREAARRVAGYLNFDVQPSTFEP